MASYSLPWHAIAFLAMTLVLPAPSGTAQEKVALRLHLDKGDVFRFLCSNSMTESIVVTDKDDPAQEKGESTAQEMDVVFRAVSCGENGSIQLSSSIKWLRAKVNPGFGHKALEFDSKAASATTPVGKTIDLSLDATGKVTLLHGSTELMRAALQYRPDDPDQALATETMLDMFADENMKAMWGLLFASLPRDPIGLGDRWAVAADIPTEFSRIPWTLTYYVKSITDEFVDVTIDGATASPRGQSGAVAQNQPVQSAEGGLHDHDKWLIDWMAKVKSEGHASGTARFSRKDGLLLLQSIIMTTTTTLPVSGAGDPANITETITSRFERLRTDEGK